MNTPGEKEDLARNSLPGSCVQGSPVWLLQRILPTDSTKERKSLARTWAGLYSPMGSMGSSWEGVKCRGWWDWWLTLKVM